MFFPVFFYVSLMPPFVYGINVLPTQSKGQINVTADGKAPLSFSKVDETSWHCFPQFLRTGDKNFIHRVLPDLNSNIFARLPPNVTPHTFMTIPEGYQNRWAKFWPNWTQMGHRSLYSFLILEPPKSDSGPLQPFRTTFF